MKLILTCLFLMCAISLQCEVDPSSDKPIFVLPFKSVIVSDDKPCKDVVVNLYDAELFDAASDSNPIIQSLRLDDDGILDLEIPGDVDYIVEITKPGFVHKRFRINTRHVPPDQQAMGFKGFSIESISLFKPVEQVNYKLLDLPLILITYDPEVDNFGYDENYANIALASLDLLKDLEASHTKETQASSGTAEHSHESFKYGIILLCVIVLVLAISLYVRILRARKNIF